MSTLVVEPPAGPWAHGVDRWEPRQRRTPTLADLVVGAWEGVRAGAAVACPVCGGDLRARHAGAHARDEDSADVHCADCGCTLT